MILIMRQISTSQFGKFMVFRLNKRNDEWKNIFQFVIFEKLLRRKMYLDALNDLVSTWNIWILYKENMCKKSNWYHWYNYNF